ncbi:MAG: MBL fold metallo-hydrolase [Anaerolineales bacterium]|nr:MBL fold metallo-hydrolase [Anaerolineales bacterium]
MLEVVTYVLGPVQTNTYLVCDSQTQEAVVIDPAWDGQSILEDATRRGWHICGLWITHAHFDHLAGAADIMARLGDSLPVALHPADLPLWQVQGGAQLFGFRIESAPDPSVRLEHGQTLQIGSYKFEVRHTPGHTPGHVIFYCASERVVFCGDVIFNGSVGRTDLPGGSYNTLMESIQSQILTLPDDTRLLSGHGPQTTVGIERQENPFLS